jgi:hypothetical protein
MSKSNNATEDTSVASLKTTTVIQQHGCSGSFGSSQMDAFIPAIF